MVAIQGNHLNSDEGEDDQQPMKPVINYDDQPMDEMPSLGGRGRVGNKKQSLVTEKNQRLLNENESQHSNSYGQLPPADRSLRDHRGSGGPRVINRVRNDKGMQAYSNQGSKQ